MKQRIFPLLLILFLSFNSGAQEYLHIWSQYSAENEEFAEGFQGNTNATIRSVVVDHDNVFWLGTYRSGFVRFYEEDPGDVLTFANSKSKLLGNEVYNIEKIGINQIWFANYKQFGTQFDGLYTLDFDGIDNGTIIKKDTFYNIDSTFVPFNWPVTSLKKIENELYDEMWVGTTQGILTSKMGDTLYQKAGFTKEVISIAQDSRKNIYVLEKGNNLKIQTKYLKNYNLNSYEDQLGAFNVKKAITGPGDTIWILTNKGIIKQHFNDTALAHSSVLLNNDIKAKPNEPKDLAFDSLGNPWLIFETNGGVMHWNYKQGIKYEMASINTTAIIPDESSIIFSDKDGNIWIGTDNDGLFVYRNSVPIGAEHPSVQNLSVYPNPASNRLIVELPVEILQDSKCSLISSDGRKIDLKINGQNLLIPSTITGLYVLTIVHKNQIFRTPVSICN